METPSSIRRITRSQARAQALATLNSENNESNIPFSRKLESESEIAISKSRTRSSKQQQQQKDRSALCDLTNDSPIIGVAMASLETPSSAIAKQKSNRARAALTPGSGEALLRGQVKTLLQRVEEEADLSKLSMESRPFLHLKGLVNSPMGLLAPTPANTPQISNLSESGDEVNSNGMAITPLLVIEEQLKICQVVGDIFDGSKPESLESQKSLNRSLLLDFSEKSEITDSSDCSSLVTDQGGLEGGSVCKDDDNASVWSIQVNASSTRDEEEEEMIEQEDDDFYYHDEEEEEEEEDEEEGEDGGLVDALCEGISKISVNDKALPKFSGKHTRFVYNSDDDDEIVENYEEGREDSVGVSPSVLRLKGLPTPRGKHLRFPIGGDDN